jgi:hypothetical protein
MSAPQLEMAQRNVEMARRRMESTLGALQLRLHPKALANDAWDGVRDKSNDLADTALGAVKERPATASVALAAFVVFLARNPLRRAISRFFAGEQDESLVTTRIDTQNNNYEAAAPTVVAAKEGVVS